MTKPGPVATTGTYRMSPGRMATLLLTAEALLVPAVGFVLISFTTHDDSLIAAGIIMGLIMSPFVLLLLFFAYFPRLSIGSAGIEVRGTVGFSTILVPWSNTERFLWLPGKEGIVAKESLNIPAAKRLKNWAGLTYKGVPFYDEEQRVLLREARYVPISPFAYWFIRGSALEQLRRYSPSLADEIVRQMPAYLSAQAENRRSVFWLFAIIAALVAPVVVAGVMDWQLPPDWQIAAGRAMGILSRVAGAAVVLGILCYTWLSLQSAWQYLRNRNLGLAFLWLIIAAVEGLMAVGLLSAVVH